MVYIRFKININFTLNLENNHVNYLRRRRQKNFQGGGGNGKRSKSSKKDRNIALLSLFRGERGGQRKKTE